MAYITWVSQEPVGSCCEAVGLHLSSTACAPTPSAPGPCQHGSSRMLGHAVPAQQPPAQCPKEYT